MPLVPLGYLAGDREPGAPFLAIAEPEAPQPFVIPGSGNGQNGLPYFSWDEVAAQLTRENSSWSTAHGTPVTVTYAFRSTAPAIMPEGTTGFQRFNPAQIAMAEQALALWAEVANITFVRVGAGTLGGGAFSNNATILFSNYSTAPFTASAFAYLPTPDATGFAQEEGDVWVDYSDAYNVNPVFGGFGAHILTHEIGHAIGISHPSVYNGYAGGGPTYENDAEYWQDSQMFTVMSYFPATATGGNTQFGVGPLLHDIAAAQLLYGANMTTRTGDTVYGFNSNAGHARFSLTSNASTTVFAIWDAGGVDTLDLSGYSTNSHIDLREMAFSSAGTNISGTQMAIGNIAIARGAIIENAIGGAGNDTMIGNAVANALNGGGGADDIEGGAGDDLITGAGGDDVLNGGDGFDHAVFALASTGAVWVRNASTGLWSVTGAGTDTLELIEALSFSDRVVYLDGATESFYGDNSTDLLLRRASDGVTAIWDMEGASVASSAVTLWQAGAEWEIVGIGDFGGDGRDDLLWRRDDGVTAIWNMDGAAILSADVTLWQAGLEWSIAGVGDFNGDGRDDFLWRRASDGVVAIWQMNGTSVVQADTASQQAGLDWNVAGVGDFDGDGRDDLLLRNGDGVSAVWTMRGAQVYEAAITSQQAGAEWVVAGVADFNGDGRDDVLLRRDDGYLAIWQMNGAAVTSAAPTSGQAGASWDVLGLGDFNADGRDDILLQRDDGITAIWLMNGAQVVAGDVTSQQAGSEWGFI